MSDQHHKKREKTEGPKESPNLHCWIEDTPGMSREKFAELVGLHPTTIGLRCAPCPPPCGGKQALRIHKATEGAVSLESLIDPKPCPRRCGGEDGGESN